MYYQATITTPANTTYAACLVTTLGLARGLITKLLIAFPPGPVGLLHVQLKDKGWQIAPWSLGENFAWDDFVFEMNTKYEMIVEPYEVTILTWNDDTAYEHKVFIGVEMIEGDIIKPGALSQYPLSEV